MGKTKKNKKPRENQQKTIFGDSLGSPIQKIDISDSPIRDLQRMTFSEDKLAPFSGQTFLMMDPFVSNNFKKIKAFTDVGNIEAMSKERWGAAKRVKGQLRMYCVNDFDAQREPKDDMPILQKRAGQHGFVSHKDFMAMLDNAWFSREANDSKLEGCSQTNAFVCQYQHLPLCAPSR